MKTMTFNRNKLDLLKNAYAVAKRNKADQFHFEGHVLIMAYAKYLIEYLELKFGTCTGEVQEPDYLYKASTNKNGNHP